MSFFRIIVLYFSILILILFLLIYLSLKIKYDMLSEVLEVKNLNYLNIFLVFTGVCGMKMDGGVRVVHAG